MNAQRDRDRGKIGRRMGQQLFLLLVIGAIASFLVCYYAFQLALWLCLVITPFAGLAIALILFLPFRMLCDLFGFFSDTLK